MSIDIIDLRDFYAGLLGQTTRRVLGWRIREVWPDLTGQRVMGLGYAAPYLRPFIGEAERVLALMPAAQGVLPWPADGQNLATLVHEDELPLPDVSMDRVLLAHAFEHAEALRPFLREIWRVMTPGGRLVVIVPNRRGIWARFERTPFGLGQPYTAIQLTRVLRDNLFTPIGVQPALFVPPFASRLWLASAGAWERLGSRWRLGIAGVVMIEASKQLYAPSTVREPVRALRRRAQPHPAGAAPARG